MHLLFGVRMFGAKQPDVGGTNGVVGKEKACGPSSFVFG